MLKIGTQNITGLYVGAEKIKRAYLGEALVFGDGGGQPPGPSRLPDGYIEVSYIQSDGAQYINTGIKPVKTYSSSDAQVVMDIEPLTEATSTVKYFIYSYTPSNASAGTSAFYFAMLWGTTDGAYARLSTSPNGTMVSKAAVKNTTPRRMILELNGGPRTFSVDGESVKVTTSSLIFSTTTHTNLMIFGPNNTSTTNKISAKLYSCQIYKGTDLPIVRDFVPCVDPTGAVGLYDLVEGKFYGNSGTGTLTAGPAV